MKRTTTISSWVIAAAGILPFVVGATASAEVLPVTSATFFVSGGTGNVTETAPSSNVYSYDTELTGLTATNGTTTITSARIIGATSDVISGGSPLFYATNSQYGIDAQAAYDAVIAGGGTTADAQAAVAAQNPDRDVLVTGALMSNGLGNVSSVNCMFYNTAGDDQSGLQVVNVGDPWVFFSFEIGSNDGTTVHPLDAAGNRIGNWSLSLAAADYGSKIVNIDLPFNSNSTPGGVVFSLDDFSTDAGDTTVLQNVAGVSFSGNGQWDPMCMGIAEVPEPSTWIMLVTAVLGMMAVRRRRTIVCLLLFGLTVAAWSSSATAETIGYWRFEGDATGFVSDSSGNGLTLDTTTTAPTPYTLPASGAGALFDNPVPQNGLVNTQAATCGTDQFFGHSDDSLFAVGDFTMEAYINKQTQTSGTQYIAGQWDSGSNQRGWAFGVGGTGTVAGISGSANDLFLLVSETGGESKVVVSGIDIAVGHDYFVAASFHQASTATEREVIFYVLDLDTDTMTTASVGHDVETLHNSTASLRVGNGLNSFLGIIDEVRFSGGVVPQSDLLAVPEPGSAVLLTLVAAMVWPFLRRRTIR